ncbi:MAG: hypothetical protein K2Q06_01370, partial [Parvularculaceae bacterium]|nr:hypothetical protein [Parvularculaceae bacterium]
AASSADLLRWTLEGAVIPVDGDRWAYSGSVRVRGSDLEAWHTEHRDGLERQTRRRSSDGGLSWSAPDAALGSSRRDWRDPFVFCDGSVEFMALAAPCPWADDGAASRSRLEIYASIDGGLEWARTAILGPWAPPRVLWETPFLVHDVDGGWSLVASEVDRRVGALCAVRRWRGRFADGVFERADPSDDHGARMDFGPDFYACAPAAFGDEATGEPIIIGWASSWETARRFPWPGFSGGPISLPRRLTPRGAAPLTSILSSFITPAEAPPSAGLGVFTADEGFRLRATGTGACLEVDCSPDGALVVTRSGAGLDWSCDAPPSGCRSPRRVHVFVDGPLIEIHLDPDDRWITAAVPVEGAFDVAADGDSGIAWRRLG